MEILIKLSPRDLKTVINNGTLMEVVNSVHAQEERELLQATSSLESKRGVKKEESKEVEKIESKKEVKKEEPKQEDEPKQEIKEEEETPKEEQPNTITKEMIRAAFAKLIKAGKAEKAKEITAKFGAKKVPDLKEEDYAAVLKEVEELL